MTLVERMQELLEAERAGLVCFDQMAFFASHKEVNHFFMSARNDAANFCEGLHSLIMQRDALPTTGMGGIAEKVMALETEKERIDLIAKEMAWVVRKIDEIPKGDLNGGEVEFFTRMRDVYNNNLQICNSYQE
ncbi:MAG: hypothetical protein IH576_01945 [Deltaproteobacteria bacterium]|nr:hypothetical protein [Deltaproteobacteria bacterium]